MSLRLNQWRRCRLPAARVAAQPSVNHDAAAVETFAAASSPASIAAPTADLPSVAPTRSINPPVQPKLVTPPESEEHVAVFAGHSQWLEVYARGDQRTIAALTTSGFSLRDERAARPGIRTR